MTSEQIEFLRQFAVRLDVMAACHHQFGQPKHFAVPAWVCESFKAGHLVRGLDSRGFADEQPVVDSASIYGREFYLSDSGREAVGLEVLKVPVVVVPKVERTLF